MLKTILSIGLFSVALTASAGVCHVYGTQRGNVYNGSTVCGKGSIGTIIVNGSLSTNQTEFTGNVTVNGSAKITSSQLENLLTVDGSLISNSSHFLNGTVVKGDITSTGSTYNTITLTSSDSSFTSTGVHSIEVKSNNSVKQDLYLKNNTHINSISFEDNDGSVYLDSSSSVTDLSGGVRKQS